MAENKPIGQLPAASDIQDPDLFALEQGGVAKKLSGLLIRGYAEDAGSEAGAASGEIAGRQAAYSMYTRKKAYNYPDSNVLDIVVKDAVNTRLKSTVIKGKMVAINQLVQNGNFVDLTGWNSYYATESVSSNTLNVTANAAGGGNYRGISAINGHKYYVKADIKTTTSTNNVGIAFFTSFYTAETTAWQTVCGIDTATSTTSRNFFPIRDFRTSGWDAVQARNAMVIDLSLIFTSAELTAIGTDVAKLKAAWLAKFGYPLPVYIPYDTGSLANVDGTYQLTGRNLFDEEIESGYIDESGVLVLNSNSQRSKNYCILPVNKQIYCYFGRSFAIHYYDTNFNHLGYEYPTTSPYSFIANPPDQTRYFKISGYNRGATYQHDICINISDPSINGQYFPYYNVGAIGLCNIWDEEWEVGAFNNNGEEIDSTTYMRDKNGIKVSPSTTYYVKAPNAIYMYYYTANGTYISSSANAKDTTITTPSTCAIMRFSLSGTSYANNICINLSDPVVNGKYFPYCAPLNGIGSVVDEEDFATGKRTTRVKLSQINASSMTDAGSYTNVQYYRVQKPSNYKYNNLSNTDGLLFSKWAVKRFGYNNEWDNANNIGSVFTAYFFGYFVFGFPVGTTLEQAKTATEGEWFAYELATPVTSTETPQPLYTEDGYNVFEPVSGGVQNAPVEIEYAVPNATQDDIWNLLPHKVVDNNPDNASFDVAMPYSAPAPIRKSVIKGKTVSVNQLVQDGDFASASNWGTNLVSFAVSSNVGTATVTTSSTAAQITQAIPFVSGHTYFFGMSLNSSAGTTATKIRFNSSTQDVWSSALTASTWTTAEAIATANAANGALRIYVDNGSAPAVNDTLKIKNAMVLDLSLIFTSAELTAIGTDVAKLKSAWLKKYGYPLPLYIPYNAGSLVSTDGEYLLHGRNLYKISAAAQGGLNVDTGAELPTDSRVRSEFIKVTSSTVYRFKTNDANYTTYYVFYYDANKQFISSSAFGASNGTRTVPDNAAFVRVVIRNTTNTALTPTDVPNYQITESADEPPSEAYYSGGTIDCSGKPLNGVGSVQDEEDFVTGKRITRFGVVDLGNLTWGYSSNLFYTHDLRSLAKKPASNYSAANAVCSRYKNVSRQGVTTEISLCIDTDADVDVKDTNYSDAATFKAAMSGVMLCYELATPVVTNEPPYPLETQLGYNCLEPISGGVQSGNVSVKYVETVEGYINELVGA